MIEPYDPTPPEPQKPPVIQPMDFAEGQGCMSMLLIVIGIDVTIALIFLIVFSRV